MDPASSAIVPSPLAGLPVVVKAPLSAGRSPPLHAWAPPGQEPLATNRPRSLYIMQTAMKATVPLLPTDEGFYADTDDDTTPPKIGTEH